MKLKVKIKLLIIGLSLLFIALIIGGKWSYFLFYSFIIACVLPLIHGFIAKFRLTGQVNIPRKEVSAGQKINIEYTIRNKGQMKYPIIYLVNSSALRLNGKEQEPVIFNLGAKDIFRGKASVVCKRRGIYDVGEVILKIYDVFGLYEYTKKIRTDTMLKVYPQVIPIRDIKIDASRQMGEMKVDNPIFQDKTDIYDLKKFCYGDSVRNIAWKESAKRDDLLVKQFERRGDAEITVFLDYNSSNFKKDIDFWLEDKIVEVAASIIDYGLKKNMQVSLFYGENSKWEITKGDTINYFNDFMDSLVKYHPIGTESVNNQINSIRQNINQGSTLVILTTKIDREITKQIIDFKRKNINPIYFRICNSSIDKKEYLNNINLSQILYSDNIPFIEIDIREDVKVIMEEYYGKNKRK